MIKTVTVGTSQYNVVEASAMQQKKLLMLIGARLAFNEAAKESGIDANVLTGVLLTLPEDLFDQIAGIVLHKTVRMGGDKLVTVDDFQNRITDYFHLVAEAIRVNLQDFFDYLAPSTTDAAAASQ